MTVFFLSCFGSGVTVVELVGVELIGVELVGVELVGVDDVVLVASGVAEG
jgi:hypothetical protein